MNDRTGKHSVNGQEQMPNERQPTFHQAELRNFFFLVSFFFFFLPPKNVEG